MTFTARIEPFEAEKMVLVWKAMSSDSKEVSIKAGQGTRSIQVETMGSVNINITATLTIQGLPEGCKNTDAETASVAICFLPTPIDEYGPMKARYELARLANVALQIKDQPGSIALFIFSYPAKTTRSAIETKIKRSSDNWYGLDPDLPPAFYLPIKTAILSKQRSISCPPEPNCRLMR